MQISNLTTKLLVHFDYEDGTPVYQDESSNNHSIVLGTSTALSNIIYKFGNGSLDLTDGLSQSKVTIPASNDFSFGLNDFTIDCQVYFNQTNELITSGLISCSAGANGWALLAENDSISFNALTTSGWANVLWATGISIPTKQWNHIALVRNGDNIHAFLNGTLVKTVTGHENTDFTNSGNDLAIGGWSPSSPVFPGYIDEPRISKGDATWTTSFTPPTSEYTFSPIANRDLNLLYDIGTTINTNTELSYDILNVVRNDIKFIYDNGINVNNDIILKYNSSAFINKDIPFYYFIERNISTDLEIRYNLGQNVIKNIEFIYNSKSHTTKDFEILYDNGYTIGNVIETPYDLETYVSNDLNISYNLGFNVNKDLEFIYNQSAYIDSDLNFKYGIRWDVYRQFRTLNSVYAYVIKNTTFNYSILSVILKNLELKYNIVDIETTEEYIKIYLKYKPIKNLNFTFN